MFYIITGGGNAMKPTLDHKGLLGFLSKLSWLYSMFLRRLNVRVTAYLVYNP